MRRSKLKTTMKYQTTSRKKVTTKRSCWKAVLEEVRLDPLEAGPYLTWRRPPRRPKDRKSGAGLGDLGDWEEHVDPSSGNKYYANRVTNVGPFVEFSFAYVLLYVFRGVAYSPAFPFGTGIDVGRSTGNRIECCP